MSDLESHYRSMMNGLYGLMDDFDANEVPEGAKELLLELIEVCKSDFEQRFRLSGKTRS